ncbi:unnamed protein product [Sphacelaria rigidula]
MYCGLLLKVDVSSEHATSQRLFEVVLVSINVFMVTVVVIEAVVVSCSLRYEEQKGPRRSTNARGVTSFLEETDDLPWPASVDDAEAGENIVSRRFMKTAKPSARAARP